MREDTYFNGKFGRREEITIPLSDRSLYFGDAVYDAAIGKNRKIFCLAEHVDRLYRSARKVGIVPRVEKEELTRLLSAMTEECDAPFFLYFQFSRSARGARSHAYPDDAGCNLLILRDPIAPPDCKVPISLITAEDLRYAYCDVKTVNLLRELFAADEILVTSASKICRRAARLDGKAVGMKDTELALRLCREMFGEWEDCKDYDC